MNKDAIKTMVSKFLGWRLPESFRPDAGISFEPEYSKEFMAKLGKPPMRHEPVGTNLFDADQATKMFEYCASDLLEECEARGKRIEELERANAELKKDAERYRWMKSEVVRIPLGWNIFGWDAAIDSAMAKGE